MSAGTFVEVVGTGPDLVLVHGWAMHRGVWDTVVEDLCRDFTLHLVDLPGHGQAAGHALPENVAGLAADVVAHVPTAAWLGWSLGGLVTLQALLDHGERISRAVLVAANPSFIARKHWRLGMPAKVLDDFGRQLKGDVEKTVERFLVLETMGSGQPRTSLRELKARLNRQPLPAARVLEQGLGILRDSDYTAQLGAIGHDVLWLAGEGDRLVPPEAMQRAAAMMPLGRCVRLQGACHAPFISHPEAFAARVRDFLGGEQCRQS